MNVCPVCERAALRTVLAIPGTTVNIGDFYSEQESALRAPRGDIDLAVCEYCGLVRNVAFKASLIEYDQHYENSQMFSPTFRSFAQALVRQLVERYALSGRRVVEIGCGKGEFLELLRHAGVESAVGYDPTYAGEVDRCDGVRIERTLYASDQNPEAELVLSRHVLEHLETPLAVLRDVRRSLQGTSIPLYTEVPDARFVMAGEGIWDVIYPHVSYFNDLSMRVLLQRAGFLVESVERVFANQFLAAHARPGTPVESAPEPRALESWLRDVDAFGQRFRTLVAHWTDELRERAKRGPICLWGAGAKGVAFLNFTGASTYMDLVVDINPRKHGKYLPGTGHEIVAPKELQRLNPATVLVMNSLYEKEIRSSLAELDLDCETLCV